MSETSESDGRAERLTCNKVNRKNGWGKPKLFARRTEQGIWCWCIYCEEAHLVPAADCVAFWQEQKAGGVPWQP